MNRFLIGGAAALFMLAGCSGQISVATQYAEDLEDAEAMRDLVENTGETPPSAMPTSGSATYTGWTALNIDTAPEESYLLGETALTANFADSTISGSASNFLGRDSEGGYDDYDGQILYTEGSILGSGVVFDADGTLTGNDDTLVIDGTVTGVFQGNPVIGIDAVAGTANGGPLTVMVDGDPTSGELRVVVTD
ncbi:transferrin-binding protein-like solute binding protein [Pseudoroseicyclus tamaricis]|uniref:Transferrin-binding protein-like solute binding protein n=1 Tax=Pseudoroseicyclus tamaricis TaxID=2705421 RepID=A0A6B2K0C2_9RHOB|nr:transferrin-binding protein-like solute binding protein [Pseudoroseicyclus tamaricis]NDV01122.1 transferrin-binding protein-like solute binding protein [Pseudoroseicyclus tamaricis]